MAGLVGIMFVVCYHCFDWSSLPKVGAALLEQAATTSEGGGSSMMTVVQPTQLAERDGGSPIDLDEFYLCACDLEL